LASEEALQSLQSGFHLPQVDSAVVSYICHSELSALSITGSAIWRTVLIVSIRRALSHHLFAILDTTQRVLGASVVFLAGRLWPRRCTIWQLRSPVVCILLHVPFGVDEPIQPSSAQFSL